MLLPFVGLSDFISSREYQLPSKCCRSALLSREIFPLTILVVGVQSNGNGAVAVPPPAAAPAAIAAAEAAGTTVEELRGTTTPFSAMEKSVAKNMQASLAVAEFRATVRTLYYFLQLREFLLEVFKA